MSIDVRRENFQRIWDSKWVVTRVLGGWLPCWLLLRLERLRHVPTRLLHLRYCNSETRWQIPRTVLVGAGEHANTRFSPSAHQWKFPLSNNNVSIVSLGLTSAVGLVPCAT